MVDMAGIEAGIAALGGIGVPTVPSGGSAPASGPDFQQVLAAIQSVNEAAADFEGSVTGASSGPGGSSSGTGSLGSSVLYGTGQSQSGGATAAAGAGGTGYTAGSVAATVGGSAGSAGSSTASQLEAHGVPASMAQLFVAAGDRYGVSPVMLAAVGYVESGYDPLAQSSAGAEGVMQLMPSTAQEYGVNPFDPSQAIMAAAQILKSNLSGVGGSVPLALAGYNAGMGAVEKYGGIPPYTQTENYVQLVQDEMAKLGGGS